MIFDIKNVNIPDSVSTTIAYELPLIISCLEVAIQTVVHPDEIPEKLKRIYEESKNSISYAVEPPEKSGFSDLKSALLSNGVIILEEKPSDGIIVISGTYEAESLDYIIGSCPVEIENFEKSFYDKGYYVTKITLL